tara:strand:+ start:1193 stop:3865 length:2673 start_codon:yes stop_codon:yes gene_type:complete
MEYKKKLIEVALPLEVINKACVREKSIRNGHPSTLHLYWARRPLASARSIIFSSLIDDPSEYLKDEDAIINKRKELFRLIGELIKWENTNNSDLLNEAYKEILKSTNNNPPPILDPFAGGGTIPLEAQKLNLKSIGTDLNPLAVLINKAMIEIPFNQIGKNPLNENNLISNWPGLTALISDIKFYGKVIEEKAKNKLEKVYPLGPNNETVISWIWARSIICNNPNCNAEIPLVRSLILSSNKNNYACLIPEINYSTKSVKFKISYKKGDYRTNGNIKNNQTKCWVCEHSINRDALVKKGKEKKIHQKLIAIVTQGFNKRNYYPSESNQAKIIDGLILSDYDDVEIERGANSRVANFGFSTFNSLLNKRQKLALETFSDLIIELKNELLSKHNDKEYVRSLITYLTFGLNRLLNRMTTLCIWNSSGQKIEQTYSRQALSMLWTYAEANPFSKKSGSWEGSLGWIPNVLKNINPTIPGIAFQNDISSSFPDIESPVICTDPPYYDNILYADLSDFFYYYLRKILKDLYPNLLTTLKTPKDAEIVSNVFKYKGDKVKANDHFLNGMLSAAKLIGEKSNKNFPIIYYYAYKQAETNKEGTASTGWETFLEGLIKADYQITATWPMRTEMVTGLKSTSNVLASSIIIAVRPKLKNASLITRKEFVSLLKTKLKTSISKMMESDITPVDLQQSAIGPGMAVFTQYSKVLEADGRPMTVRTALQLINAELDRIQENADIEMDADTRFCIQWFDSFGYKKQAYGEAETLAKAKDISVQGLVNSGVFEADGGKAKLKHWSEMKSDWDPRVDDRLTLWECTHHMVKELVDGDGQLGAAKLAKFMGPQKADEAKELAYQLYHICNKREWAKHASDYNTLVSNWSDIKSQIPNVSEGQETLF